MKRIIADLLKLASQLEEQKLTQEAHQILALIAQTSNDISYDQAGYQEPNPDQSRKSCGSCVFWKDTKQCGLFDPKLKVLRTQMCNYYVYGKPEGVLLGKINFLDAKTAGLISPKDGGTSCDNCPAFNSNNTCKTIKQNGKEMPVNARGCCNFWGGELKH